MAMKLYSDSDISDIADAIRSKNGSSDTYKVSQMASAIQAIPTGGITPTGTKSITANGTGIDVYSYQYADVAVPNSYSAGDEGKVVSNGALVSQTSDTVTANDTYDTTLINSLTVNVSGSADNMLNVKYIKGSLGTDALKGAVLPEKANFEQVTYFGRNAFSLCTGMKILVCPAVTGEDRYPYADNAVLETFDRGASAPNFNYGYTFSNDSHLTTLILRNASVVALPNLNCFTGSPFASGGTGGTLYVPSSLISSYQSATNWSTILGYANNNIQAIEGSQYENYYADGTPIS